jgi:hypothetical protein
MFGRAPGCPVGIEGDQIVIVGQVAQPMAAILAADILEVERVAAMVAAEEFHERPRDARQQCAKGQGVA